MIMTNTRRWPRYHVHLPVFIAAKPESSEIIVPGMVCELSRTGMELYGGVNLQPGEMMEVEFRTSGRVRVAGIIRHRSGFCFGLEFCSVQTEPEETSDGLQSQVLASQEAYLREMQQKISQSLQALEKRRSRKQIEVVGNAGDDCPKTAKRYTSGTTRNRSSRTLKSGIDAAPDAGVPSE
jgi:hypothetical protein